MEKMSKFIIRIIKGLILAALIAVIVIGIATVCDRYLKSKIIENKYKILEQAGGNNKK